MCSGKGFYNQCYSLAYPTQLYFNIVWDETNAANLSALQIFPSLPGMQLLQALALCNYSHLYQGCKQLLQTLALCNYFYHYEGSEQLLQTLADCNYSHPIQKYALLHEMTQQPWLPVLEDNFVNKIHIVEKINFSLVDILQVHSCKII